MKSLLFGVCLVLLSVGEVLAQASSVVPPVSAAESKMETLKQPRTFENANLRDTLVYLGEQANVALALKKDVRGTFSLKIEEPVVPFEALRRIADQLHLFIEKMANNPSASLGDRTYTVWTRADFKASAGAEPVPDPSPKPDDFTASFSEMGTTVAAVVTKMDDELATYLAKPETTAKRAKFYKNLYEALMKEGFKSEDALKMTLGTAYPSLSDDKGAGKK